MMKSIFPFVLTLIFWPVLSQAQNKPQDYYTNSQLTYKFALHLYQQSEYQRAANELERSLYLLNQSDSVLQDSILVSLAKCYHNTSDYHRSNQILSRVNAQGSYFQKNTYFLKAKNLFFDSSYESNLQHLKQGLNFDSPSFQRKASQLITANHLMRRNWQQASNEISAFEDQQSSYMKELSQQGANLPHKSPLLAGAMSTAIPGSGKMYTGRWRDGIFSFFMISTFMWRAYEGYKNNKFNSANFWIFGTVGTYFYLGNIYGSAVSARNYNQNKRNQLFEKVKNFVEDNF